MTPVDVSTMPDFDTPTSRILAAFAALGVSLLAIPAAVLAIPVTVGIDTYGRVRRWSYRRRERAWIRHNYTKRACD